MTLKELIDEEIELHYLNEEESQEAMLTLYPAIERAAIRFSNQQNADLMAKILDWRRIMVVRGEDISYDGHFGISTERYGRK